MTEQTLLTLLGTFPKADRLAEHLPTFLSSHGFEDAASLLGSALARTETAYDAGYDAGWDDGHLRGFNEGRKAKGPDDTSAQHDMAGDGAPAKAVQ